MEFDVSRFTGASFKRSEEDVPIPDLRDWFKGVKKVRRLLGACAA